MESNNQEERKCSICNSQTHIETFNKRTFHICNNCNFVFTDDYNNNIVVKGMGMEGSWTGPGGGGFREYFLVKLLCQELNLNSFLLFGTGNTKTFEMLLEEQYNVIGCDISEDVVEYKNKKHGDNLFFTPSSLPSDIKFDAIIAVEVIEHFNEPKNSFTLLFNHLNTNGIICGTTDYFIGQTIQKSDTVGYMNAEGHIAYWNNQSLNEIAKTYNYQTTAFEMIRPGSVLPDEKFGKLWPNKRVFFLHSKYHNQYFSEKFAEQPILPIDKP